MATAASPARALDCVQDPALLQAQPRFWFSPRNPGTTRRLQGRQNRCWPWGRIWRCDQMQEWGLSGCSMEDSLERRPGVPARDSSVWKASVLGGVERSEGNRAEPADLGDWETDSGSQEGEGTPNPPGSFPDPGRVGQNLQSFGIVLHGQWAALVPSSLPRVHDSGQQLPASQGGWRQGREQWLQTHPFGGPTQDGLVWGGGCQLRPGAGSLVRQWASVPLFPQRGPLGLQL